MVFPAKTDQATVLRAALQQVENEGAESLAIRSVAARLGLAPNALYRYFESLAALEAAVAEEARRLMLEEMQAVTEGKEPADAVRALAETYLRFAEERPRLFALYMKTRGDQERSAQCLRNTEFFWEQVSRVYEGGSSVAAAHGLWAFLHGLAGLRAAGVLTVAESRANLAFWLRLWLEGASLR